MGKFDYAIFETDEDVASVWVAKKGWKTFPPDYFEERYTYDDDDEFSVFSAEFKIGWHDHDFQETASLPDGSSRPVGELLQMTSFSASFGPAVVRAAEALGLRSTSLIWTHFNFRYDPEVTGIVETPLLQFVGVFPFSPDAGRSSSSRTKATFCENQERDRECHAYVWQSYLPPCRHRDASLRCPCRPVPIRGGFRLGLFRRLPHP